MASPQHAESGIGESNTPIKFKPYTSILTFSSAPTQSEDDASPPPSKKRKLAPWRGAVGRAHFDIGLGVDEAYEDEFAEIMESTFSGCSDEIVGSDIPIVDFAAQREEADWEVDEHPGSQVPGEQGVLYDLAQDVAPPSITKNRYVCSRSLDA